MKKHHWRKTVGLYRGTKKSLHYWIECMRVDFGCQKTTSVVNIGGLSWV